jgi:AcrR family transcriptional regulator
MVDSLGPYHGVWSAQPEKLAMDRLDRSHWLAAAFEALGQTGWQDVRINALCARLGVTKGSFYWHFESREALLFAVLAAWETAGTEDIIATVDATDREAPERLRLLLHTVFAPSSRNDRIEAAIRAWAASDPAAAATVARVDDRRLAYVRDLLQAAGASRAVATHRSAILYRTLIGEFTWRSHGGPTITAQALEQLYRMVLPTPSARKHAETAG